MNTRRVPVAIAATLLASTSLAAAQPAAAPPPPPQQPYQQPYSPVPPTPQRQGFMIGFSVGLGAQTLTCDGCDTDSRGGFGFDFSIGGFLNPTLALMYDASAVSIYEEDGGAEYFGTNSTNTFAAQIWLSEQTWLKGGAGVGRYFITGDYEAESEAGFGLTGAGGYEFSQSRNFAIDGQIRLASVFYDGATITNLSALIGFNWY